MNSIVKQLCNYPSTLIQLIFVLSLFKCLNAAYDLPANVAEQAGLKTIVETFKCVNDGYFADIDNECKIYHHCNSYNQKSKRKKKFHLTSKACGPNQMFDQSKFVCKLIDEAIPCEASADFFYLNERIGQNHLDFLTDADIEKARHKRPQYRARARARAARA